MRCRLAVLWAACAVLVLATASSAADETQLPDPGPGTRLPGPRQEPLRRRPQRVGDLRRRRKKGRRRGGLDPVAAGRALLALAARPDADLRAWHGLRGSLARAARRCLGWPQDTDQLLVYMSFPPEYHQKRLAQKRAAARSTSTSSSASASESKPESRPEPDFDDTGSWHHDL